jgi:hypothetical protein
MNGAHQAGGEIAQIKDKPFSTGFTAHSGKKYSSPGFSSAAVSLL